nr:immunoglobulin heavy chain junction region [Macaca mulatta]MOW45495.1 immunoglobulin heavy chain junction region [Macaca mulatta]MOW45518.1 immunoglobulin heavy chain junction region [Macaca mulatta]MOW45544.1 immunoglobulin heavy chain junction region [Macaca mulatta]MOW45623.1 immunoglobulin heavy chain junction region [Macaca mulatta]
CATVGGDDYSTEYFEFW